jgi:hypothetical protein
MTTEHNWGAYDSIQTAISSGLDSLADGSNAISSAIDFTAAGVDSKQLIDGEISLASVDLSSSVNPAIYIWVLKRTDGTNFEDGGASVDPARRPDAIVPLRAISGTQRVPFSCLTNPDQGKILFGNRAGAALASSGNTIKYYTYGDELV